MKEVNELLEKLGYKFRDESLLVNALTHSSYSSEHKMPYASNNERLEFIGDAYVDAAVGAEIFMIMKDAPEGVLSKNRADVVREESLADAARGIGLPENVDGTVMRKYIDSHRDGHDEHDMSEGMGLIDENTIQGLSLREVNSLLPFDAKSMIYSEIMENGEYTGMVEYVDCTGDRVWDTNDFKAFKTVSRLIGAFTVKGKAIKNMSVDKA